MWMPVAPSCSISRQRAAAVAEAESSVANAKPARLVVGLGDDSVIVELKAAPCKLGAPEKQQLRNYMNILGIKKGLLVNFPQPERQRKREAQFVPEFISIG
jgi:GxxExxY protein